MRDMKANSARHLNEKQPGFAWQDGYAAISVSPSEVENLRSYIETQETHHSRRSFESEYVAVLDKSGALRLAEHTFG